MIRVISHNVILSLLILLCVLRLDATTYFVMENGAGLMDGTSWSDAAAGTALQSTIDNAMNGDTVWVSCGTYTPTTDNDRTISFAMRNGVEIYGSFLGTESTLGERDISCGPCSILSGEIGLAGSADNSYTVVSNSSLDSTAVLDGFTIRDGNDNRSPSSAGRGLGGGLYNHGFGTTGFCHPVIRNCLFTNNRASWGGGAFNNAYNNGETNPTYINCIFYQNHAYEEAGAFDTYAVGGTARPVLKNCLFYENTSDSNVGAMYAWGGNGGSCHPELTNCVFVNNDATNGYGGAFIADNQDESGGTASGSCSVTLQNCILWNNTATGIGQSFYVRGNADAEVIATYSNIDMNDQVSPHVISGSGVGNIDIMPLFQNIMDGDGVDECWFSDDDGLQLQEMSPCVDSGDNNDVSSTDILGNNRVGGPTVDMGSYESQAVLPVQLISFNVVADRERVKLEWSTVQEVNNDYFIVEKSTDGSTFYAIGRVEGSHNSNILIEYEYYDHRPSNGINYYRLRQIDFDGRYEYSNILTVEMKRDHGLILYPNPATDYIIVEMDKSIMDAQLQIIDANGVKHLSFLVSTHQNQIDISQLPMGIFTMIITTTEGQRAFRFMRE